MAYVDGPAPVRSTASLAQSATSYRSEKMTLQWMAANITSSDTMSPFVIAVWVAARRLSHSRSMIACPAAKSWYQAAPAVVDHTSVVLQVTNA